jgi:hypothetical protein
MNSRSTIAVLALVVNVAGAQESVPPRRAHHALVYDEGRKRILMTAGSTPADGGRSFTFFNDLWEFDGARWTALTPSGGMLSGIAIAYDAKGKRVLSFGGYNGQSLADLRVLEPAGWRTLGTLAAMPAAEPGFVYDARGDRFIAFGGSAEPGQAHSRTWSLTGTTWSEITGDGPPARQGHAMVYDERRGRVVVFGGAGAAQPGTRPHMLDDTWEFDGSKWARRETKGAKPSARASAGAAYDSRRGRLIIFGGADSAGFLGDTWAWDGVSWTKLSGSGPEPRVMGYMAYDKSRDRVVLFGGRKGYPNGHLNDTWEFNGTRWARVIPRP